MVLPFSLSSLPSVNPFLQRAASRGRGKASTEKLAKRWRPKLKVEWLKAILVVSPSHHLSFVSATSQIILTYCLLPPAPLPSIFRNSLSILTLLTNTPHHSFPYPRRPTPPPPPPPPHLRSESIASDVPAQSPTRPQRTPASSPIFAHDSSVSPMPGHFGNDDGGDWTGGGAAPAGPGRTGGGRSVGGWGRW